MADKDKIVDWGCACGRYYLSVAGHVVATEGEVCRDMGIFIEEGQTVGEAFFGRDRWTPERIKRVAEKAQAEFEKMRIKDG